MYSKASEKLHLHSDDILGGLHHSFLSAQDNDMCAYENMNLIEDEDCELDIPPSIIDAIQNLDHFEISSQNPVGDYLILKNIDHFQNGLLSLFDIKGKTIFQESLSSIGSKIPLENINSGVYFLVFKPYDNTGKKYYQKLIKI